MITSRIYTIEIKNKAQTVRRTMKSSFDSLPEAEAFAEKVRKCFSFDEVTSLIGTDAVVVSIVTHDVSIVPERVSRA